MKKSFVIAMLLSLLIAWQPQLKIVAQSNSSPKQDSLNKKNIETNYLFKRVTLTQDSILAILSKKKIQQKQQIRYIKIYEKVLVTNSKVDTLMVGDKNTVTIDDPDVLPSNYYLIKDTMLPKKKTFFQRLFGKHRIKP